MTETIRELRGLIPSVPASDGAGVKLRRSLGSSNDARVDPFLMLDEFFSDDPDDYLAGFPAHPHRGFETVTYMLDGHMQHQDHMGNQGDLDPGGVQWMTAGRGIIHSEMPQQTEGRMRGFQLWLNLPAREKMKPADYRDIPGSEIPEAATAGGGLLRLIAGSITVEGKRLTGAVNATPGEKSTDPIYVDVRLQPGERFEAALPRGHSAFVYLYDGEANLGEEERAVQHRASGVLGDGDLVRIVAGPRGASLLLLAAKPIREPIVQYGPFVMNTREEIEQALADYQAGRLAEPA